MSKEYLADKETLDEVNGKVGTTGDTESSTPTTLFSGMKKLLSLLTAHINSWTAARATKIDTIDTNAARFTSARAGYVDKLNNGTYGLEALKGYVDEVESLLKNTTYGLNAIKSEATAAKNATNRGSIKSIQRGICSKGGEQKITINAINPNKAFVLLDGQAVGYEAHDFSGEAYLVNLTEMVLTIYKPDYTSSGGSSWQVIELY